MNGTDLSQLFDLGEILAGTTMSSLEILLSLSITFLMSMFVYFVYKKTYNGVLYSKNFNITLVMTAIAINSIIIGISGNIVLSLGMVGALSIIRFRTAIKDPRDTAFIFWAMTIGIVNGVGYYELSFITSAFLAGVLWILSRSMSFEPSYMLILKYSESSVYKDISKVLDKKDSVSNYFVRSDSMKSGGIEKVIEVKIKKGRQEVLLDTVRAVAGVESCTLLSSNGEFTE